MRSPFADVVRHVVTFATLVLLAVRIGGAQTIRGRVVAKADGAPVSSAIVSLIDTTGSAVATKLADDSGSFSFVAPLAGRYAVRAERVGFLSANSSFRLFGQGEAPDVLITMTSEAVSLRAIVVNADRRCLVRPQEGVATAQLWSEARKALSAIQLTALAQATAKARRDPHRFLVRWRSVTRDLDPNGLAVLHSDEIIQMSETVLPFASADLDVLTRDGYMIGNPDSGSTFFAPDADILLSDRFLDSHCFRLEAPEADRRDNLIGLAFEPVGLTADRRSLHVDVRGVLWLDRASAELRYMEYHYVNLPPEETTRHAGGLLEFRPLPDGRWVVWRWYIRVPVLTRRRVELNSALSDWHTEIAKIHEDGAELLEVMPAGTHRTTIASLHGSVIDSLSGVTMAGVRVFLSGTSFAAVTRSDGTYLIDSIPPGSYSVSIIAPRFDSLLLNPPVRAFTLMADENKRLDLASPGLRTLSSRACAQPMADSLAMIVGFVHDTGVAAPDARVRAEWTEDTVLSLDHVRSQVSWRESTTARDGRYVLCGVPSRREITLRVVRGSASVAIPERPVSPGEVRRLDLTLRKPH
jgi:hypothetical protein